MSLKKLTAYALIGSEHRRIQEDRLEKIKGIIGSLSDDEYEQMLTLSKTMGDEQMMRDLPVWRAMVKKP